MTLFLSVRLDVGKGGCSIININECRWASNTACPSLYFGPFYFCVPSVKFSHISFIVMQAQLPNVHVAPYNYIYSYFITF